MTLMMHTKSLFLFMPICPALPVILNHFFLRFFFIACVSRFSYYSRIFTVTDLILNSYALLNVNEKVFMNRICSLLSAENNTWKLFNIQSSVFNELNTLQRPWISKMWTSFFFHLLLLLLFFFLFPRRIKSRRKSNQKKFSEWKKRKRKKKGQRIAKRPSFCRKPECTELKCSYQIGMHKKENQNELKKGFLALGKRLHHY